jgi:hypothetical protein
MPAADVTAIKVDSFTSWRTERVPSIAPPLSSNSFAPQTRLSALDNAGPNNTAASGTS